MAGYFRDEFAAWNTQPEVVSGIEWDNPLSKGLTHAFVMSNGILIDAVTNRGMVSWTGASRGPAIIAKRGRAERWFNGNGSTYGDTGDKRMSVVPESITLFSVWHMGPNGGGNYFSGDGTRRLLSNRGGGFAWGRLSAVGGGGDGNVTKQAFTLPGVADYQQGTSTIPAFVPTSVACTWIPGTIEFFDSASGRMKSEGTVAVGTMSTGSFMTVGQDNGGSYWLNASGPIYVFRNAKLTVEQLQELHADPWQLLLVDEQRIWVPVSAGSASTITAAAGTSTTSTIAGSSTAASSFTEAAGASTASSIAASSTSAAALAAAAGTSTTSTLAGAAVTAAAITQAAGTSTTSALAASSTAASAITGAAGASTASAFAGSSNAAAAFTSAAGASTAGTLVGSDASSGASAITAAVGASTTSSLAGSSVAAAALTGAAGASTAGSLAGASVAAAAFTTAAGTSTASTLSSAGVTAASMSPAAGSSSASAFAASAVAATVAVAAAGASSAQALAASSTAAAAISAAAGVSTCSAMVDANAVDTNSAWWTYTVPADDLAYLVPTNDLRYTISADSLAFTIGV